MDANFDKNRFLIIKNIIKKKETTLLNRELVSLYSDGKLVYEGGDIHYKNSFGLFDFGNQLFKQITPKIEKISGLSLTPQNSYGRIYLDGGILKPHIDRESLDLTLAITIENSTGKIQPLSLRDKNGNIVDAELNVGDALLIYGRELEHWRNEIRSVDGGMLNCIFLHWSINDRSERNKFVKMLETDWMFEEDSFVSDLTCERFIAESNGILWSKSTVYEDGEIKESEFRSSETIGIGDLSQNSQNFIKCLDSIIANMLGGICVCRFEGWQMSRYKLGKKFDYHTDTGIHVDNERLYTVILYLNDDFEGGETDFRNKGVRIKPKKGKLVIWRNLDDKNQTTDWMLHSGLEVKKGIKYVLVNFIRLKAINQN